MREIGCAWRQKAKRMRSEESAADRRRRWRPRSVAGNFETQAETSDMQRKRLNGRDTSRPVEASERNNMCARITMAVSSASGNTAVIAKGVRQALVELGWDVAEAPQNGDVPSDETVVVCFWCRKSSLDPKSLRFVQGCSGKRILLFGTMGGFPVGRYADQVRSNVERIVNERNECLGVFLCQGKVRADRIEERHNLPANDPHHLDEWGVARLTESLKHPDETDILYARSFARDHLGIPRE